MQRKYANNIEIHIMGQRKGQTGNPTGRPKGARNKATTDIKTWISGIIDQNRMRLEKDLKRLEPKERWSVVERLIQYITPRMQSATVEAQIQAEYAALEKMLNDMPDEAIERLTERIRTLNGLNIKNYEKDEQGNNIIVCQGRKSTETIIPGVL